jgi:hypothetical protein
MEKKTGKRNAQADHIEKLSKKFHVSKDTIYQISDMVDKAIKRRETEVNGL